MDPLHQRLLQAVAIGPAEPYELQDKSSDLPWRGFKCALVAAGNSGYAILANDGLPILSKRSLGSADLPYSVQRELERRGVERGVCAVWRLEFYAREELRKLASPRRTYVARIGSDSQATRIVFDEAGNVLATTGPTSAASTPLSWRSSPVDEVSSLRGKDSLLRLTQTIASDASVHGWFECHRLLPTAVNDVLYYAAPIKSNGRTVRLTASSDGEMVRLETPLATIAEFPGGAAAELQRRGVGDEAPGLSSILTHRELQFRSVEETAVIYSVTVDAAGDPMTLHFSPEGNQVECDESFQLRWTGHMVNFSSRPASQ